LIEIKDLYFSYNSDLKNHYSALKGINLKIGNGEFVSIMGSNGSGKSTLVLCMKGILKPVSGRICIDDININDEQLLRKMRNNIGIVFQNPDNQFISTSVEREIAFGLENLGIEKDEIIRRIDEIGNKFNLTKFLKNSPETLSGGEKQKVALATILAMHPNYLILDEATSYLDPQSRSNLINLLKDEFILKKNDGFTIILVTQFPNEALVSQRLIIMDKGGIVMDGEPNQIFKKNVGKLKEIGIRVPAEYEIFC
jgi:energy-coupling factor transport system ATP-binding protein